MKIKLPKWIRRNKMEKEFKSKCLKTYPCHCCAYYNLRGKYRDQCKLRAQLLNQYKLTERK